MLPGGASSRSSAAATEMALVSLSINGEQSSLRRNGSAISGLTNAPTP